MQFGSVEFFKVLIKTVLCIFFFVPLVLCVVFGVLLWNSNQQQAQLEQDNEKLEYYAEILSGEREPTVKGFYDVYARSGLSDDDLIEYVLHGKDASQQANAEPDRQEQETDTPVSSSSQAVPTEQPTAEPTSEPTAEPTAEPLSASIEPESLYADIYPEMTATVLSEEDLVREDGTVYLTFDDGPSENTYSILRYLEQYNIKATFFVVPTRTESCYEKLRAIVNAGHSIGVHSGSHVYTDVYASVEAFLEDFHEAWDIIYEATGVKTEIFRFPGGSVNDFNTETRDYIIQEMTRRGFRYFDWNVDSNDAGGANWTDMYNSIPRDISQNYRSVVLMHDSASTPNTVLVLGDVLQVLVNEGYKFDKINNNTRPVQFTGPFA